MLKQEVRKNSSTSFEISGDNEIQKNFYAVIYFKKSIVTEKRVLT